MADSIPEEIWKRMTELKMRIQLRTKIRFNLPMQVFSSFPRTYPPKHSQCRPPSSFRHSWLHPPLFTRHSFTSERVASISTVALRSRSSTHHNRNVHLQLIGILPRRSTRSFPACLRMHAGIRRCSPHIRWYLKLTAYKNKQDFLSSLKYFVDALAPG